MDIQKAFLVALAASSLTLTGCIDLTSRSTGGEAPPETSEPEPEPEPAPTNPPEASTASIAPEPNKRFLISWGSVDGADYYQLLENPDGISGFSQVGDDIPGTETSLDLMVPLHERYNAEYILSSCNDAGCEDSDVLQANSIVSDSIGFIKAINSDNNDEFGNAIDISGDGSTLAIAHQLVDTNSPGGSSDPMGPDDLGNAGAVHIYSLQNGLWVHDGYIQSQNPDIMDQFGESVSLSDDGNTLVVSSTGEDSIDPLNPADNSDDAVGAVYVFERSGGVWTQESYLKGGYSAFYTNMYIGSEIKISGDGNTLAIAVKGDKSDATGVNGDPDTITPANNDNHGSIWVYSKDSNGDWIIDSYLKPGMLTVDGFAASMDMSKDGTVIVAGASSEDSCSADQSNDGCSNSGAAYVFEKDPGTDSWSETAFLKPDEVFTNNLRFGIDVSISGDGSVIALGSMGDSSLLQGINPTGMTQDSANIGAAYVFKKNGKSWDQNLYVKPTASFTNHQYGHTVALDFDGSTLVVSARNDRSAGSGVQASKLDGSILYAGAAYVYKNNGSGWFEQAYLKPPVADRDDRFGEVIAISDDGESIFIQAPEEDGPDAGGSIESPQYSDDSLFNSGAVYVY